MRFDISQNSDGSYSIYERNFGDEFFGGIILYIAACVCSIFLYPRWSAGILTYSALTIVLKLILHFTNDLEKNVKIRTYGNVARFLISEAAMYIFGSIDIGVLIVLTTISSGRVIHTVKKLYTSQGIPFETDRLWLTAKYVSIVTMIAAFCSVYVWEL